MPLSELMFQTGPWEEGLGVQLHRATRSNFDRDGKLIQYRRPGENKKYQTPRG